MVCTEWRNAHVASCNNEVMIGGNHLASLLGYTGRPHKVRVSLPRTWLFTKDMVALGDWF